jgi:hypothetical protein
MVRLGHPLWASDADVLTMSHLLILESALWYALVFTLSLNPMSTESTYAVRNVIISNT